MYRPKVLFIDNYDSFASTIAAYLTVAGADVTMVKSDASMETIRQRDKDMILLGPGPNGPTDKNLNYLEVIDKYHKDIPLFGVCLGFQALVHYFGGSIHPLKEAMHGKSSDVSHDSRTIFKGIPTPSKFARYHSLGTHYSEIPHEKLEVSAIADSIEDSLRDHVVMGIRHKEFPDIEAIQFHPESILSGRNGELLIENVVRNLMTR